MGPCVYRVTLYDPADRDEHGRPRALRRLFGELDGVADACCAAVEACVDIAPRARLAVWTDLTGDAAALRARHRAGRLELLVVQLRDGRVFTRVAESWMFEPDAQGRVYAHGEMRTVIPLTPPDRDPLLAAVLPDRDGVVRARWRTNPTRADERRAYLRGLRRGQIRGGVVTATPRFGVFVELDGHRGHCLGFINVPELSWLRFDAITDVVEVGQRISVEVLAVDLQREQAALSLRATQPDPWKLYVETLRNGQIVPGTVTKLIPFGAFVRLREGVEGLVHIRELTDGAVETPDEVVREGDEVDVMVIGIDLERRRISLSRKQAAAAIGSDAS